MTPIIRSSGNSSQQPAVRRRIIPRGTLSTREPGEDNSVKLLPPSEVFDKEEEELPVLTQPAVDKAPKLQVIKEEDEDNSTEEEVDQEPKVTKKLKAKKIGVNPITDIMEEMRSGEAVMIKKDGLSSYTVSIIPNDILVSKTGYKYLKKGLSGKQYWDEVLNPEFPVWSAKWGSMTYDEKLAYAIKNKIVWNKTEDARLNVMLLTEAVRKSLNIEKYKPEYRKRSARAKVRG